MLKNVTSKLALILLLAAPVFAWADMDVEITINWVPPTENVDGSPLTDLSGYTVYYGTASGGYTGSYNVSDPAQTSDVFTVLNVVSGEEVFVAMTAWDNDGNESAYSNEISFGPFLETDTVAPASAGGLSGTARIVRCGNDTCSGGS